MTAEEQRLTYRAQVQLDAGQIPTPLLQWTESPLPDNAAALDALINDIQHFAFMMLLWSFECSCCL